MTKLTPAEWTQKTLEEFARRKYIRERAKLQADSFLIENRIKTNKALSRIRCKCYRGK